MYDDSYNNVDHDNGGDDYNDDNDNNIDYSISIWIMEMH